MLVPRATEAWCPLLATEKACPISRLHPSPILWTPGFNRRLAFCMVVPDGRTLSDPHQSTLMSLPLS